MELRLGLVYQSLLLVCLGIGGCANFGNVMTHPVIDVKSVQVVQVTPDSTRMVAVLQLQNPNPLFLHLKRVEYRMMVDRATIISSITEALPLIKNEHTQMLEIPILIKNTVLDNAFPDRGQHRFRFVGQAIAVDDWVSSPILFEAEGDVTFPRLPVVRFIELASVKDANKIGFFLELTNPNSFMINVRRLQGQLEVDGHMYRWTTQPKSLKVNPNQSLRIHIPCQYLGNENRLFEADLQKVKNKVALKHWLQGEIETESLFGKTLTVIDSQNSDTQ